MQKPFSHVPTLALLVLCLPLPSLVSASHADSKGHSTSADLRTPSRIFTDASAVPSRGRFTGSSHASRTCASNAIRTQNKAVYLYASDGPQQIPGATINEGAVYDAFGAFIGALNPADSQIYNQGGVIGFVSPSDPGA